LSVKGSEVDRQWLNKLGAVRLKRGDELVRLPVSQTQREQRKRRLAEEAHARNRELLQAEQEAREAAQSAASQGLLDRPKRWLQRRAP